MIDLSQKKPETENIIKLIGGRDSGSSSGSFRACEKFYPSVECGPISINKAKSQLDFEPTTLESALRQSIKFLLDID